MLLQQPLKSLRSCLQTLIPATPRSAGQISPNKAGSSDNSLHADPTGAATGPFTPVLGLRSSSHIGGSS
eukprot:1125366-Rhodomonas_salina.1